MHCTAGLFGGDVLECAIHVEAGARVLLTQQSATKVHPARGSRAIQRCRIRVEAGGELHIYNDAVIPFAESVLSQTTLIDIDKGSRLYFWESFMAGRIGRGEVWKFDEFSSETRLRMNGQVLYLDRFRLTPKQDPPTGEWTMARARYLATGLCFDDRADFAERLHGLMPKAGVDAPAAGLVVARVAVDDGPDFHSSRTAFVSATMS
jgi:urease accessory protein